jgi:hypothetical protein
LAPTRVSLLLPALPDVERDFGHPDSPGTKYLVNRKIMNISGSIIGRRYGKSLNLRGWWGATSELLHFLTQAPCKGFSFRSRSEIFF